MNCTYGQYGAWYDIISPAWWWSEAAEAISAPVAGGFSWAQISRPGSAVSEEIVGPEWYADLQEIEREAGAPAGAGMLTPGGMPPGLPPPPVQAPRGLVPPIPPGVWVGVGLVLVAVVGLVITGVRRRKQTPRRGGYL